MSNPAPEIPRYRCHKEVHALLITGISINPNPKGMEFPLKLYFGTDFSPIDVDREFVKKHDPQIGGYYVIYADGYASWSPAKAFEEGYTKIE